MQKCLSPLPNPSPQQTAWPRFVLVKPTAPPRHTVDSRSPAIRDPTPVEIEPPASASMRAFSRCLRESNRHHPITGDLIPLCGSGARVQVFQEDSSSILLPFAKRSTYIMSSSVVGKECLSLNVIPHTLPPLHVNHRSIFTRVSVDEQEVTKALELFHSSIKDETITMKEQYALNIEELCRAGNLSGAAFLLGHLQDRQIHICLDTYNILLATAGEANNFNFLLYIFKNLLHSSLPPNSVSYMNVTKAFQKVAETELLKFVREVSEITGHKDPMIMNRIIFMTAKSGQLHRALMIYEELKKLACRLDNVTFNTVLAMLGRAGRVDQMLSEFNIMKDLGHHPDIVTYNTLINCLHWLGKLDLCNVMAKEMIDKGIELDLRSYTALIDGLGRAGHVQDAVRIFDEMKKSQQPSIYIYRSLISNLKKTGKYDLALNLLEEMNANASKILGPEDFKQKKRGRENIRLLEMKVSW